MKDSIPPRIVCQLRTGAIHTACIAYYASMTVRFWSVSAPQGELSNEWYFGYDRLKPLLRQTAAVPSGASILVLGCGQSLLAEEIASDGFANVTAIDYSVQCIRAMAARQAARQAAAVGGGAAAAGPEATTASHEEARPMVSY